MPPSTYYAVLLALVLGVGCAISPKETLPGTYALDEGGVIVMILRKNGTVENYTLGEFDGGKKTYKTVGKEVHILDWKGTSVFKIEPNGDLTLIAKITKGKREKLKVGPSTTNAGAKTHFLAFP